MQEVDSPQAPARKPPYWLKPGDQMVVRVEGIGELVNPVVAEG